MPELIALIATTAGIAAVHTLLGPDHYLPFVAMSRARQWTRAKTLRFTLLCGFAHVIASVLLGAVAIGLGWSLTTVTGVESLRGQWAAWALVIFGLAYAAWGVRKAIRNERHTHWHAHPDGSFHDHEHQHHAGHVHVHEPSTAGRLTGLSLLGIFILGPCEPLLPLMLYPAATGSPTRIALVVGVFTIVTLVTMAGVVLALTLPSRRFVPLSGARWGHAVAGLLVCACGLAIRFAGL